MMMHRAILFTREHLGMLNRNSYRLSWEKKLRWYAENEILAVEDGGARAGTLVTTRDDSDGGISSGDIERTLDELLGVNLS